MPEIKNSTVLITGGAGFVGSFIVDQLIQEGVREVVVVDNFYRGSLRNLEQALATRKVKILDLDIRNSEKLDAAFKNIDYCFHMAALRITRCAECPKEAIDVMVNGTYNVIESCLKHGIQKLVAASSASIYGTADVFPTKEDHHSYNNRTLYGALKMANEGMYRAFNDMQGLNYNAMRYFNIYGPRMDTHGKYTEVLIRWHKMIKEGKPPVIYGEGNQTMDFIHVADVARANILALKAEAKDEIFNVASSQEISLKELCLALLKAMSSDLAPTYIPMPDQRKKVEVTRRLADISKASNLLGFKPKISLKEGLNDLVRWLEQIPSLIESQV